MYRLFQISNFNLYQNIQNLDIHWKTEVSDFRQKTNYISGDHHTRKHSTSYLEAEITGIVDNEIVLERIQQLSSGQYYIHQCFATQFYTGTTGEGIGFSSNEPKSYIVGNYCRLYITNYNNTQDEKKYVKFKVIFQTPQFYRLENDVYFYYQNDISAYLKKYIWNGVNKWNGSITWDSFAQYKKEISNDVLRDTLLKDNSWEDGDKNNFGIFTWEDTFFDSKYFLGFTHINNYTNLPKQQFSVAWQLDETNIANGSSGITCLSNAYLTPAQSPTFSSWSNINLIFNDQAHSHLIYFKKSSDQTLANTLNGFFYNKGHYIEIYNMNTKSGFRLTWNLDEPSPLLVFKPHTCEIFSINLINNTQTSLLPYLLNGLITIENIGYQSSLFVFENQYPTHSFIASDNQNIISIKSNITGAVGLWYQVIIKSLQTFLIH